MIVVVCYVVLPVAFIRAGQTMLTWQLASCLRDARAGIPTHPFTKLLLPPFELMHSTMAGGGRVRL